VRCAIREIIVDTTEVVDEDATGKPVLSATDCLFESVTSAGHA